MRNATAVTTETANSGLQGRVEDIEASALVSSANIHSTMATPEQRLREFLDRKDLAMLSGKPLVFEQSPKFGRCRG